MPQLIPGPWFYIFTGFWIILLVAPPLKILKHHPLTFLSPKPVKTPPVTWFWPWS